MSTYRYKHPELDRAWHTQADTLKDAKKRFEDAWALRIHEGLLESVDGNFYDGTTTILNVYVQDDLCPNDLSGHMVIEDTRSARHQFTKRSGKPVACLLCKGVGWGNSGLKTTL